ncbi:hypothetical protein niasHT_003844 [Heterodera trifolii]|uniref:Uncharacterized protein n=1 Tax=Heterodera trifolii TaxID=157864 RepID=A0ABD2LUY5_9BILA
MAKLCNDRSVRFAPFLPPSNAPNSLAIHKLCLALLILQLSLSLSQVFHNSSLLLALHPSAFHYETSRLVVFVSLFVNLSWSLSVISAIFGLARNNTALILPNLSLSVGPLVPSSAFPNGHFACADSLLFLRSFDSQFVGLCLRFGRFNSNRMDFIEANSAKGISRRDLAMKAKEMEKLGRNGESLF